ncbi:peptidyl-tRNA hydrolase [Nakamurella flavida]|uniref:peptidyl-tRNA hydrolase n=2 Tax=Nakamurella flavida TaxID=363630 RepID=A0A938YQ66_9ACTN|nr:peptidyl-tRNA hydrolase [Nakamurella flavida]
MGQAPIGGALAPLRARYAKWMALAADRVLADREEPADEVRAMQLIVRMERQQPPSWTLALAAAASAAARLCLDPRSEPGGAWHEAVTDYCAGHIRKVTRRARAGHWAAAGELPGVLVEARGTAPVPVPDAEPASDEVSAEVRALVPGLVDRLDPRISRLQVGGTDVAPDAATPADDLDADHVLQVWLPPDVPMTLGKTMAQTGHAGMIAAALMAADEQDALRRWRDAGCPVRVHGRTTEWPRLLGTVGDGRAGWRADRWVAVRDAGFTEIAPGTVTVLARAPR